MMDFTQFYINQSISKKLSKHNPSMTPDTVEEEEMFDSRMHNPAKLD